MKRREPIPRRPWTPRDEEILRRYWPTTTRSSYIADVLVRSFHSVREKARKMGLRRPGYPSMPPHDHDNIMGCTCRSRSIYKTGGPRRHWTGEETARLEDMWERGDAPGNIAEELGRTRQAVIIRASRVGLIHNPGKHSRISQSLTHVWEERRRGNYG